LHKVTDPRAIGGLASEIFLPPKNGEIDSGRPLTEQFPTFKKVVFPGSESSITEITEYKYFSPLKPSHEFEYKSELNTVPLDFIIEPILF